MQATVVKPRIALWFLAITLISLALIGIAHLGHRAATSSGNPFGNPIGNLFGNPPVCSPGWTENWRGPMPAIACPEVLPAFDGELAPSA